MDPLNDPANDLPASDQAMDVLLRPDVPTPAEVLGAVFTEPSEDVLTQCRRIVNRLDEQPHGEITVGLDDGYGCRWTVTIAKHQQPEVMA